MPHDYANEPYRVGKGKPPREFQWTKGQPSPNPSGRPKGSSRESQLQKMLKRKVWATDADGRRVRKTLQEVIDYKLIEAAAKNGDLKAIKLIHEILMMQERFQASRQPTREEIMHQQAEQAERDRLSAEINEALEELAEIKRETGLADHGTGPESSARSLNQPVEKPGR